MISTHQSAETVTMNQTKAALLTEQNVNFIMKKDFIMKRFDKDAVQS